jgi:hypothetical protein
VLKATVPLAVLGLAALVTGRMLAPAVTGVGAEGVVRALRVVGSLCSQWFVFAAMMTAIVAIMAASRSRLPIGVRIAALALGGFAVLPTMWALFQPMPDLSAALVAGSASLLALAAVPSTLRPPFARGPGLVVAFIALGGLLRLGAVALALRTTTYAGAARGLATGSFLVDAVAVAIALVWIASRNKKLTSPSTLAVLAVALLITRQALAGQAPDAHGLDLMAWRSASRLLSLPEPSVPLALRVFVSVLAPLTAVAALFARDTLAPLAAAVALALSARGAVEMPPCALMLMVAALGAALTASDPRALWRSLASSRS